jgi:hypothetical protein
MQHDASPATAVDFATLTGTRSWCATPGNYSSLRCLTFAADGTGQAIYGYGQTIYAEVRFAFELLAGPVLRLTYLPSPAGPRSPEFRPGPDNGEQLLPYTLTPGDYRGDMSIVRFSYVCGWRLSLASSPWPVGMALPYEVPTEFFGYRRQVPRPAT